MKIYEQLTPEMQEIAYKLCIENEIKEMQEMGEDYFPEEGFEKEKQALLDAFQEAEDLQTPVFTGAIIYENEMLKSIIDNFASDACSQATYTEPKDEPVIHYYQLEAFKKELEKNQ